MSIARIASLVSVLALATALPLAAAQQVELHLRTGAVVKGELVSEDNDKVVVKSTTVGKSGKAMSMSMPYKRADIAELIPLADAETVYQTKMKAATTASDFLALAQWCREQSMNDQAVEHAKKSVALDAKQDAARALLGELGWVEVEGKWMKEADALAAQGKVRFQGKIMTLAEAEALKTSTQKQAAADDKAGTVAAIDRQLEDLQKRSAQTDASLAKANSDLAAAQGLAQKVVSAKAAVDSAQQDIDRLRAKNNSNQNGAGHATGEQFGAANMTQFTNQLENAKKQLAEAQRESGNAEALLAKAKSKVASLTDEKKAQDKKREDLTAKRAAAVKELEQAKAAGNAAAK